MALGPIRITSDDKTAAGYWGALAILALVFFMWGFATVLNDILVPHLKSVFNLDYYQSLLLQFFFYLAYFIMSLPGAFLLERIGYKSSVVVGLFGMAGSALLFLPAAQLPSYPLFLIALFLLGSSIALLQVAANPYVAVIGAPAGASSRLNLVQTFNSAGTMIAPLFGGLLILGRSTTGQAGENHIATAAERLADAKAVQLPYVGMAIVLALLALLIWKIKLPDIKSAMNRHSREERQNHSLWKHRNLVFGVPAIFIYLIAEIGIGSTLINFISKPDIGGLTHEAAANYVSIFWGGAMVGRLLGAIAMNWLKPERLLAAASIGAFILALIAIFTHGPLAMWALIAVGLCHSIMFPTIFTLGIKGLGPLTEEGSGLLIMAIAGGALSTAQGWIADRIGLQLSYLLPAACYIYVLFYAVWGSKPTAAEPNEVLSA